MNAPVKPVTPRVVAASQDPASGVVPDDGRRRFLKIMAASAALAGSGCSKEPPEPIVPYVDMPERRVPGQPVFYASTLVRNGFGTGVLVETDMGRPIKIEGNARHPASLGATDAYAQAAILQLWDPDRSRAVRRSGLISTWEVFRKELQDRLAMHRQNGGEGLYLLTGSLTSPTLLAQISRWQVRYPAAQWHRHDPTRCGAADSAAQRIFGQPVVPVYRLDKADLVVTLDADIFSAGVDSVRNARDFMQRRHGSGPRNRLYAIEATPGLCGALADTAVPLDPIAIEALLGRLAERLGMASAGGSSDVPVDSRVVSALVRRLDASRGASCVIAGPTLSASSHALVWRLNQHLGNIGKTVNALPVDGAVPEALGKLVQAMQSDRVQTLIMLGVNPVYDTPAAMGFDDALARVKWSVHLGLYHDETGHAASWHIPQAHDLESWSDARGPDGTASIVQPVIAPLYGGRSAHTLMAALNGDTVQSAHEQVQNWWRREWRSAGSDDFSERWRTALRLGVVDGSAPPYVSVPGAGRAPAAALPAAANKLPVSDRPTVSSPPNAERNGLLAIFATDPSVAAGEFSNNAWLQELPRPLSKITWDNAALMSPETAASFGVVAGDVVSLRSVQSSRSILAPVWIMPGHAPDSVTLPLGYGRHNAGVSGNDVGFNAYMLQGLDQDGNPMPTLMVELQRTELRHQFARTQNHMATEGRDPVHVMTPQEVMTPATVRRTAPASLYPARPYKGYAWGMSVDLDACIGCNACTIACQSENNIPVVGKEEVARGHEMHWIRIDLYRDEPAARTLFQPVACVHCENAPCEVVCPVGATMHDSEGLNVQVYNRCVGTRFCSNNCPYKVRRFNFFQYADKHDASSRARQNPDVTVRQRGVMEKCTYCVQRISHARIEAQKDGRSIADGEVVTACQAVCPTQAIVFGDINDPQSRVSKAKASPRDYGLLEELNTRPRTTYLARVVDPDAGLEDDHD